MKVTVAFGDVKVVVPCGNGDITIRQLSELAITRYQKSIQQDTNSPRMSVMINALVLARDCGILDWDDSVSDVVDDRELIIARFQNKPNTFNINNNNDKYVGANTNSVNQMGTNNNHYLCSDWKYCMSNTDGTIGSCPHSMTDEKVLHNSSFIGKTGGGVDLIENQSKIHSGKNGSCLVSLSPDSIDSTQHMGENINSDQCCSLTSNVINQPTVNKESVSLEESDSSMWPVPPPLLDATSEEIALRNKFTITNALETKYLSSSNPNNPSTPKLPFDYVATKINPVKHMSKQMHNINHDILPESLSSSLPSNADAKSLPQSFYSSLDSTAVSDNNNSSCDETNPEIVNPSKAISINQLSDKIFDENILNYKPKSDSIDVTENLSNTEVEGPSTDVVDYDLNNIPEDVSIHFPKTLCNFPRPCYNLISSDSSKATLNLQFQTHMPPPMPPLRSAFTKLSPNPIRVSIPPVNFLSVSNSDLAIPAESVPYVQGACKTSTSETKTNDLSKSEHSIPSLFESDDRIPEDLENEWSLSGKSGDQESLATTTTETSVNTTTTATTNSHSIVNKSNEKSYITVTLKKSSNGFGFSLTSRQNPIDLTNPVYVSKVLENGPAIFDGRMKPGDRIVMINDDDVSQLSQKNIKDILLNIPAESLVKIGLFRPSSDAITNLLDSINTSNSQKNNSIPQVLNHAGDKLYSEDCNQICVEDQKPVSFPMCSCVHKNSQPCSKLNLYHFTIHLRTVKSDFLTPQMFDRSSSDSIPKTVLRSQNLESKTEPPAIPLNHQNKLSPCSFSNKPQSITKASNATLGISVRRGFSQMSYNDSHHDCQNLCHDKSKAYTSSKMPEQDLTETFSNNYTGNLEESVHKFCPNCHGLLSLKNGVFVKSIIPGGAAHMDGRVQVGDEIIAVQGVCLHNGEDFLTPNNKTLMGDIYDSLKFAQIPLKFQNRIQYTNMISSNIDSSEKTDPLTLLKQILSHAQSICSSVSLIILRRSLEQRSCSINTLASVDANYCHNVTVAADIHTPYKNDDFKNDHLLSFIMPTNLPSAGQSGVSSVHKQRLERFEEYHSKDHHQRYYRDDRDNSPENRTSDLICLQSEHGSDDQIPAALSENNSLPSPSHTNNASLADSYHVSSGILTDFEKLPVPKVTATIYEDSSVVDCSVDYVVKMRHQPIKYEASPSISSEVYPAPITDQYLDAELDLSFFNRNDSTRKSFSTKGNILKFHHLTKKLDLSKRTSSDLTSDFKAKNTSINTMYRPVSELILYQVPEEDVADCLSSSSIEPNKIEYSTQTMNRRTTLKRRGGINKFDYKNDIGAEI